MKSPIDGRLRGAIAAVALLPGLATATDAAVGWQSRYITEGRDNLTDGGLVTAQASHGVGGWSGTAWLGVGDAVDYQEVNLTVAYDGHVGPVAWTAALTRLLFEPDDATDTELSLDLALPIGPTALTTSIVYSDVANGTFVLLGAERSWTLADDGLVAAAFVRQGLDAGYASPRFDGASHTTMGGRYTQPLTATTGLQAELSHSIAGPDVRRAGGGDQTWLTVAVLVGTR